MVRASTTLRVSKAENRRKNFDATGHVAPVVVDDVASVHGVAPAVHDPLLIPQTQELLALYQRMVFSALSLQSPVKSLLVVPSVPFAAGTNQAVVPIPPARYEHSSSACCDYCHSELTSMAAVNAAVNRNPQNRESHRNRGNRIVPEKIQTMLMHVRCEMYEKFLRYD